MSDKENNQGLISRYLLNRLSGEEAALVERKLQDPQFQKEVAFQWKLMEAIEFREDTRLKARLQTMEAGIRQGAGTLRARRAKNTGRRLWIIAAAAVLLLLIGYFWLQMGQDSASPEAVYASRFEPYPNTLVPISRDGSSPTLTEEAFRLYEDGAFAAAIPKFETLLAEQPDDDVRFFYANALMGAGRTGTAIPVLEGLIRNGTSQFLAAARWYLALAYVRQEQPEKARPLLEALRDDPFFGKKAEALLESTIF